MNQIKREEISNEAIEAKKLAKEGKLFASNNIDEIMKWLNNDEDPL